MKIFLSDVTPKNFSVVWTIKATPGYTFGHLSLYGLQSRRHMLKKKNRTQCNENVQTVFEEEVNAKIISNAKIGGPEKSLLQNNRKT